MRNQVSILFFTLLVTPSTARESQVFQVLGQTLPRTQSGFYKLMIRSDLWFLLCLSKPEKSHLWGKLLFVFMVRSTQLQLKLDTYFYKAQKEISSPHTHTPFLPYPCGVTIGLAGPCHHTQPGHIPLIRLACGRDAFSAQVLLNQKGSFQGLWRSFP